MAGSKRYVEEEYKIELRIDDETGEWTASSPDYPGWKTEGKESSGCADIAARDLERWVENHE